MLRLIVHRRVRWLRHIAVILPNGVDSFGQKALRIVSTEFRFVVRGVLHADCGNDPRGGDASSRPADRCSRFPNWNLRIAIECGILSSMSDCRAWGSRSLSCRGRRQESLRSSAGWCDSRKTRGRRPRSRLFLNVTPWFRRLNETKTKGVSRKLEAFFPCFVDRLLIRSFDFSNGLHNAWLVWTCTRRLSWNGLSSWEFTDFLCDIRRGYFVILSVFGIFFNHKGIFLFQWNERTIVTLFQAFQIGLMNFIQSSLQTSLKVPFNVRFHVITGDINQIDQFHQPAIVR